VVAQPGAPTIGQHDAMTATLDLVDRLITAIESGDIDGVRACYSPDVVVWANFDGETKDLEASLRVLAWLVGATTSRRYEVTRRVEIEGGALQQHVLHATVATTGKSFAMPACLVLRVEGDRIVHIDEYLDASVMTPAFATD
jgi:ketosteroid isomerase-like protein